MSLVVEPQRLPPDDAVLGGRQDRLGRADDGSVGQSRDGDRAADRVADGHLAIGADSQTQIRRAELEPAGG